MSNAVSSLRELLDHPVTLYFDRDLHLRAFEIASTHNLPSAYDAQYLALAERLGCEFWTVNERLYNSVRTALSWVQWVGTLTA